MFDHQSPSRTKVWKTLITGTSAADSCSMLSIHLRKVWLFKIFILSYSNSIWTLNFLNGALERFWLFSVPLPWPTPSNSYFFFSTQGGKYCSASPLVIGFMDRFSRWRQTGRPEIPQNCSTVIDLRFVWFPEMGNLMIPGRLKHLVI